MDLSNPAVKQRYMREWAQKRAARRKADGLCTKCGEHPPREGRKVCRPCLDASLQKRLARIAEGICFECGKPTTPEFQRCEKCRAKNLARYYAGGRVKQLAKAAQLRQALKREVCEAYGGAFCACCGETRMEFLSVDHINGDGKAHRASLGIRAQSGGWNMYAMLKRHGYPAGIRILCMNCNFALGHVGYCPHQREREAVV